MRKRLPLLSLLTLAGTFMVVAACTSDSNVAPTPADGGLACGTGECPDAQTITGNNPVDSSADDATSITEAAADVATDTNASADAPVSNDDAGVIVGCVPQEVSTRYDATWIFGAGCRADWNANNQVTFSTSVFDGGTIAFTGFEGTIAAANAATGALFAASDGIALYNGQGVKTNDASLGANESTSQAVAFIGKPGSASDFYIVANAAASGSEQPGGLYWTELPCGQLVPAAAPALIAGTDQFTEALATVRNANNVDRWVLSVAATGVAVIPVTASGFGAPAITPWNGVIAPVAAVQRAFIAFARDRHTFALTAEDIGLVIGQFDNGTGAVSHLTALPVPTLTYLYSAAFSPDGTKLYASSFEGSYYQIDLAAIAAGIDAGLADGGDAGAAVTTIGAAGGALRLAIDDHLYVALDGQSSLTVVSNPNAPAAQLQISTATLPVGCTSSYGFPGVGDL